MSRFYDLMIGGARAHATDAAAPDTQAKKLAGPEPIRLDSNESPYGPAPRVVAAVRGAVEGMHKYPDDRALELRHHLAGKHGLEADQLLISPGSTALLGVIARTMLEPGLKAITSERSFVVYSSATRAAGGELIETSMRNDGFDLEAILAAIDEQTRVIFVANPNNPTGSFLDAKQLDEFLAKVPSHVMVVLDEAYYDYAHFFAQARKVEYPRSFDYVREVRNVVVLRTFSKAHGLAGVRVGYGVGPAGLMGHFANVQDVYAVSAVAQTAALAALEEEGHVRSAVEKNAEQAAWMEKELQQLHFRVLPTWANFLYVDVGQDAEALADQLRADGILVRPLADWGAPSAVRMTVGTSEQNHRLLTALRKVVTSSA
jgi:histidinol-phosphate aminotransferase